MPMVATFVQLEAFVFALDIVETANLGVAFWQIILITICVLPTVQEVLPELFVGFSRNDLRR